MHAVGNVEIGSKPFETGQIIAGSDSHEVQIRNDCNKLRDGANQRIRPFISLRCGPATDRQDDPASLREPRG